MGSFVTLINLKPPYSIKASTLSMAANNSTVLQILIREKEIAVKDLLSYEEHEGFEDEEDDDKRQTILPLTGDSFKEIFGYSSILFIPDSMFYKESNMVLAGPFIEHAIDALKEFYISGGTVVVMCIEGISNSIFNNIFNVQWKIHPELGNVTVNPTPRGKEFFGPFCPEEISINDNPYFAQCEAKDGLFQIHKMTKEEFVEDFNSQDEIFERLGIPKDETLTCFDVEKSWDEYVEKCTTRYAMAIHDEQKNQAEQQQQEKQDNTPKKEKKSNQTKSAAAAKGQLVWWGDRSLKDELLSFCICKIVTLAIHRKSRIEMEEAKRLQLEQQKLQQPTPIDAFALTIYKYSVPILIVLAAIMINMYMKLKKYT